MSRVIKGLFKWSLQITGASIIWFNYQSYDRQKQILALYKSAACAFRIINQTRKIYSQIKSLPLKESELYQAKIKQYKLIWAQRMAKICQQNGGIYSRLGKVISEMVGVVDAQYIESLSKIQSRIQLDYEQVKLILQNKLQKPLKQIFDGIQPKQISSTQSSHIYKAVLLQNYRQATVQIIPPLLSYQSQYDQIFLNKFVALLKQYKQKLNIPQSNFNFIQKIYEKAKQKVKTELDLNKQIENTQKLQKLILSQNCNFYVPYIYKNISNRSVLIKEYIQGFKITQTKNFQTLGLSTKIGMTMMLRSIQQIMLKCQLINTNINQSNILFRKYQKPSRLKERLQKYNLKQQTLKKLQIPTYQIVFIQNKHFAPINKDKYNLIVNYWKQIKKLKKLSSLNLFRQKIQKLKTSQELLDIGLFNYYPLLKLSQKWL